MSYCILLHLLSLPSLLVIFANFFLVDASLGWALAFVEPDGHGLLVLVLVASYLVLGGRSTGRALADELGAATLIDISLGGLAGGAFRWRMLLAFSGRFGHANLLVTPRPELDFLCFLASFASWLAILVGARRRWNAFRIV